METRRLLWLIALAFSVVLLVQYFELPYGYILSNLSSLSKFQEPLLFSGPNSTRMNAGHENVSIKGFSDGKVADEKQDFEADIDKNSNYHFSVSDNPGDKSPSSDLLETRDDSRDERVEEKKISAPDKARANGNDLPVLNCSSASNSSKDKHLWLRSDVPAPNIDEEKFINRTVSQVSFPPLKSPYHFTPQQHKAANQSTPVVSSRIDESSKARDGGKLLPKDEHSGVMESSLSASVDRSSVSSTQIKTKRFKGPPAVVVPISSMNSMLLQSRFSHKFTKPKWPSQADEELLNAKRLIEEADITEKVSRLDESLYRNFSAFLRSYELMEKTLKIYIYAEGEKPIFHQTELTGIYASEGWFMKQLEENEQFVTKNPNIAHLFYLPFSSRLLEETLYIPNSHSRKNLVRYLSDYLKTIATTYRFWNRTAGADHFLVACHDWAPAETSRIMRNCIRSLCNADAKGGFQFGKDVSLPETYIHFSENPLEKLGGKPASQRKILAFFAGKMHGYLRPILLNHWENKDPDMKIFGKLNDRKGQMNYAEYMKRSKYCISAKGYEGNTPRVVEAILYECVPVIISDNYVPPFFETLNWESFAVFVLEKDIPNLKSILLSIPEKRYAEMQQRVKWVQKHFLWHATPVKYDIFHMILHSIWYTRVFQMRT